MGNHGSWEVEQTLKELDQTNLRLRISYALWMLRDSGAERFIVS